MKVRYRGSRAEELLLFFPTGFLMRTAGASDKMKLLGIFFSSCSPLERPHLRGCVRLACTEYTLIQLSVDFSCTRGEGRGKERHYDVVRLPTKLMKKEGPRPFSPEIEGANREESNFPA